MSTAMSTETITLTADEMADRLDHMGRRWTKGSHDRFYIDIDPADFGIETNRYGSGNVASATRNGVKLSNNKAQKFLTLLSSVKAFVDLNTGTLDLRLGHGDDRQLVADTVREMVANALAGRVSA